MSHKVTVVYSQEQKEKAKRVYHTIIRPIRAIFTQQRLPKSLWAETAKAVVYLQNRSPICQVITTEFENLKSERPYLGYFCTFGYQVRVHIPKKKAKSLMIDLIKIFTWAMKVPTNIGCTILNVAEFLLQKLYILIKLNVTIKQTWSLKTLLMTIGIKKIMNFLQISQIS